MVAIYRAHAERQPDGSLRILNVEFLDADYPSPLSSEDIQRDEESLSALEPDKVGPTQRR